MANENGNVVDNIQTALWEPRISKSKAITTHIKVCTWWIYISIKLRKLIYQYTYEWKLDYIYWK
jgi:hypothetical protein